MDKNEKTLQEQEAPLKNTDDAFVKVSRDGSPNFPLDESTDDVKSKTQSTSEEDQS